MLEKVKEIFRREANAIENIPVTKVLKLQSE